MSSHHVIVTAILFLSLGLDTFAVAVGLGLSGLGPRERLRSAVSFAIAEGLMPLVGFALGLILAQAVGSIASYVTAILLIAIGAYAVRAATHEEKEKQYDIGSPARLAILALSVSLDELAVGFGLGLLGVPILLAVAYMAIQAFVVTLLGVRVGALVGEALAERAELLSGLVLGVLGAFLLIEKFAGS